MEEQNLSGLSDSEDEDIIQSTLSILLFAYMMLKTKFYNIYLFENGRDFIENISTWTYNNPLNIKHVQEIKKQLKANPFLTGVFSMVKLNNGYVYLIDGHHRHQALLELYEEGFIHHNIHIEVHCYESDTITSSKTMSLFAKLNHTKPFKVEVPINILALRIINFMEQTFSGVVKDLKRRSYPYIRKKELNDALQDRISETENFNYDMIVRNISRENGEYQSKAREIFRNSSTSQTWENVKKKVQETGCYLALGEVKKWVEQTIKFV